VVVIVYDPTVTFIISNFYSKYKIEDKVQTGGWIDSNYL